MSSIILAVTHRSSDISFANQVATLLGMPSQGIGRLSELKKALVENPDAVIFWDLDHETGMKPLDPLFHQNVADVLRKSTQARQVFVITDEALNQTPTFFNAPVFAHHLQRRYEDPTPEIIGQVVLASLLGLPMGLGAFFPKDWKIQKMTIAESNQRTHILGNLALLLRSASVPTRITSAFVQATDELILNAMYGAPLRGGVRYREQKDKNEFFTLDLQERVQVEFAYTQCYFCVCIRDHFGSITREDVLKIIRKDYREEEVKTGTAVKGGGLGIYRILGMGFSLMYLCEPGAKTEAYLFVPVVKNMREFRKSFRFWSII